MRILLIHQQYLRPGEPGGSRFNDFARHWRAGGHEIEVVASSVRYASGAREASQWPWSREQQDDVEVLRTWALAHTSGRFARRAASMVAYAGLGTLAASIDRARPDVVIASSPTLAAFLPGLIAASRWRTKLVLEVRDLWPESVVALGGMRPQGIAARAAYGFEEAAYEQADLVVALTPGIRDRLLQRGVVPSDRCVVIPNGVDLATLPVVARASARERLGFGDRFVAVYAGAHGVANGLDQLVDAAELLRDDPDIVLLSIGDGPERERLCRETAARGLENLRWLPAMPRDELFGYLCAADAGIVSLRDTPTFHTVYPNKMFDYMAARIPVVLGVEGVAAEVVTRAEAGVCFPPQRPHALAQALLDLRTDPNHSRALGRGGRRCVETHYDRAHQAQRYLDLIFADR